MKAWLKKYQRLVIVTAVLVVLSVVLYFVLPDIQTLQVFFKDKGMWTIPLFIVVQVLVTSLLCFVPGTSAGFIALAVVGFNMYHKVVSFLIAVTVVTLSSKMIYFLGRFGGVAVAYKLVGEEDTHKAQRLLNQKAKVFLPLMYMLPIFPDDALCMVAGVSRLNVWYHTLIVVVFRGIGVATIVFLGSDFLGYATFRLVDWFVFISVCIFWLILLFFIGYLLDKRINK